MIKDRERLISINKIKFHIRRDSFIINISFFSIILTSSEMTRHKTIGVIVYRKSHSDRPFISLYFC